MMKKEISFKTFLTDLSNWLSNKNKKNTDIQSGNNPAMHDIPTTDSGFDHAAEIHQPLRQETQYDRYYPLYLQDRDVNSHF